MNEIPADFEAEQPANAAPSPANSAPSSPSATTNSSSDSIASHASNSSSEKSGAGGGRYLRDEKEAGEKRMNLEKSGYSPLQSRSQLWIRSSSMPRGSII
ncbi:hypothetical protein V6N11_030771 [Hibiscus sabdariffa]|uniref:Uncharacterized protein n=1 Tax=Hibiscus sabdariffa TaxID=183260 RepID=A0ABR2NBN2_9ROSI